MPILSLSLIASIALATFLAYVLKSLDLEQQTIGSCKSPFPIISLGERNVL